MFKAPVSIGIQVCVSKIARYNFHFSQKKHPLPAAVEHVRSSLRFGVYYYSM